LTAPRSLKPPSPDSADVIATEIEVHQLPALLQHSCKPLCIWSDNFTLRQLECRDAATALLSPRVASRRSLALPLPCHCGRRLRTSCSSGKRQAGASCPLPL
jgi:hypothetical protein